MRALTDSIDVDVPPEQVWAWLQNLTAHYADWHPDHVAAGWILGEPNEVGSVMEAVENLGGRRERIRFEITQVYPPRLMEYRIRGLHSLFLPRGAFEVFPRDGGSSFTASIWHRGGKLAERLFRRRIAILREHMREEGQNLQRRLTSRT
jgi:hypothetical protein